MDFDLTKVQATPVGTPVPMAIVHVDGSPTRQMSKSALMKKLEGIIVSNPPTKI